MKPIGTAGISKLRVAASFLALLVAPLLLSGCNYARMYDDEAVQAYNEELPRMPKKTIPVGGGIWIERESDPSRLVNALPSTPGVVAFGAERYGFYCVICHGERADGNSTVGQSFAPLPADLAAPRVRDQSDGEIFYKVRFGFNRHPPLYSTMTDHETWAVIRYVRSLGSDE